MCPTKTQWWRIAKKYFSARCDEDLGDVFFEIVRSEFSTHTKVPLVRGKLSPNAFYEEICQFFIPDLFLIFFKFLLFLTKFYISLCSCNILLGFDTFPWIYLAENMEEKKEQQAWGHYIGHIYVFLWASFFSNFCPDKIALDKSWCNRKENFNILKTD